MENTKESNKLKNKNSILILVKKEDCLCPYDIFISSFTTRLDKCLNENYSKPFTHCKFNDNSSISIMVATKPIGYIKIDRYNIIKEILFDNEIYAVFKSKIDNLISDHIGMRIIIEK